MELAEGAGDVGEVVTHEPYFFKARVFKVSHEVTVFGFALCTQFTHLSDDGHLAGHLHPAEVVEGGLHRGGVGVIGVDDEVVLLCHRHLRAVVAGGVVLQGLAYLLSLHAEVDAHGDGSQQVVDVVGADEAGLHLVPLGAAALFLECHQGLAPAELQEGGATDDLAADAGVLLLGVSGVGGEPDVFLVTYLVHQVVVVGIDEDEAVLAGAEEVVEFALGLDDALERAEALQVRLPHIGDEAAGRFSRLGQRLDVARVAGAHLDDGYLVVAVQPEEGLGHTHVVVEVALGEEHVVFLLKHGCHEFLGCGLAVGARDADDGDVELPAMLAGQGLEGLQAIVNEDEAFLILCIMCALCIVHNGVGTALFEGGDCEFVTVESLAFKGEEDGALGAVAAVSRDAGMLLIESIKFLDIHKLRDFCAKLQKISDNLCNLWLFFVSLRSNMDYSINVQGRLMDLSEPQVMGILNVTPDSFFARSRKQTAQEIAERANQIVAEGGTIIDVGACSTRPGADVVSEAEEMERLRFGLDIVRRELPYSVVSVDTFRPDVARMAVEEFGADIINDVSEGAQPAIFRMVAQLRVPYILTSVQPTLRDTLLAFSKKVQQLRDLGAKDIILDPGFGFGKTLEQNYQLMNELERLLVMELPLLVGVSRKSMIYKMLGHTANEALNGTTVLNTIALMKGASILRVHDVKEAVECVRITELLNGQIVK